jgi:hypothetical protein
VKFSKEGFRKLVEKCNVKGIKITGSTLEALELEDRFDSGELERERIRRLEEKKKDAGNQDESGRGAGGDEEDEEHSADLK